MYSDLRSFYESISHSVKLSYYCKLIKLDQGNLSKFIKGYDKAVDLEKLILLRDLIISDLSKKIA